VGVKVAFWPHKPEETVQFSYPQFFKAFMNQKELIQKLNTLYNQWQRTKMDSGEIDFDVGYEEGKIDAADELEVIISELENEHN